MAGILKAGLFAALLLTASVCDVRKREIPDILPVSIVATGLMFDFSPVALLGALAALPLFIAGLAKPGSIGGGDIKLMAAAGSVLGLSAGLFSLCAGLLAAVLFHLGRRVYAGLRKEPAGAMSQHALPLAPFLTLGCILALTT